MNPDFLYAAFFSAAGLATLLASIVTRLVETIRDRHQPDNIWPDETQLVTDVSLHELLYTIHSGHDWEEAA